MVIPKEQIVADPFYSALSGLYKGLGKEWGKSRQDCGFRARQG